MHVLSRTKEPVRGAAAPVEPPGPTVGQLLRDARSAAGLTVPQISAMTRIRMQVVEDLEADRFQSCGGSVYARGHLRALAHAAGVDACPIVEAYGRQTGHPVPVVPAPPPEPVRVHDPDELDLSAVRPVERDRSRWPTAVVASLSLLLGALVLDTYRTRDRGAEEVAAPLPVASAPVAAPAKPQPPKPKPAAAPTAAALVLRVGDGGSWVRVSTAARILFEGTVKAGWQQAFADPAELRLRVGNAAAVRVTCAGKDLGPAGATGAVVTVRCGRGGVVPG